MRTDIESGWPPSYTHRSSGWMRQVTRSSKAGRNILFKGPKSPYPNVFELQALNEPRMGFVRLKNPAFEMREDKLARGLSPQPSHAEEPMIGIDIAHSVNAVAGRRRSKLLIDRLVHDGPALQARFVPDRPF